MPRGHANTLYDKSGYKNFPTYFKAQDTSGFHFE